MELKRNMGNGDRILRGVAGIWLLAVAASAMRAGRQVTAITAFIAGFGVLGNAASGFCGGNRLLGIDTTSDSTCPRD